MVGAKLHTAKQGSKIDHEYDPENCSESDSDTKQPIRRKV